MTPANPAAGESQQTDGQVARIDPTLLAEARIKVEKLREFVREVIDEDSSQGEPATPGMVRDFNTLRAIVVGASPRLAPVMPPESPDPQSGEGVVTQREIVFFCEQIKEFLDRWADSGPPPEKIDVGTTLFGPDGLRHDPTLLAAARIKAQSLLDFVQDHMGGLGRVAVNFVEDHNRLLALIVEAAPESATLLPRAFVIPVEPKPEPDLDHAASTSGSRFFRFLRRNPGPRLPTYQEFFYNCLQIARILK